MSNEKLDVPLLLLLMWASFAALAQVTPVPSAPSVFTEGVLIALITSITTTAVSLATLWVGVINKRDISEIKTQTNHITTELAARSREAGHAEGVKDQKVAQAEKKT